MLDDGEWPRKMEYVLCEDFNENKVPKRTNLDLRKALQDVSLLYVIITKNKFISYNTNDNDVIIKI